MDLAEMFRPGNCQAYRHLRDDDAPDSAVADYIWTWPAGDETRLCTECCARWRASGTWQPKRIRSIERAQVFVAPAGTSPDKPGAWVRIGEVG